MAIMLGLLGPDAELYTWNLLGAELYRVLEADEEEQARSSKQQDGREHAG